MVEPPIRVYDLGEVAKLLGLHRKTVEIKVRRGELGSFRDGRLIRVRADQLQAYIDRHTIEPAT